MYGYKAAKLTLYPKCTACQYEKQRKRPSPGKTSHVVKDCAGTLLWKENLVPKQQVSCDHFICSTKGQLFGSQGKTANKDMFTGSAIFVDHATGYIEVEFQKHLNSHKTLAAKQNYELKCSRTMNWNVVIMELWCKVTWRITAQASLLLPFLSMCLFFNKSFGVCQCWCPSPQSDLREISPKHHVHRSDYDAALCNPLALCGWR